MSEANSSILYAQHLDSCRHRANTALARAGFDHLVVPSGTRHYQVFDDIDYPYAVNPQFKAWLPLTDAPGSWLVYTPGERPKLIYLQPHDYWHATPADPAGAWVEHFDIHVIREPEQALPLLPSKVERCAILGEAASALGDYVPNNPPVVLAHLDWHRGFKTDYEVQMMRKANAIAARAHRSAERAFRAGASEFGIHLAYCMAAGQDSNDLPYNNIIALNENAAILHYTQRARVAPAQARSFLIDAGASHAGYAADISRTYSSEDDEFASMIQSVDKVQLDLCKQVTSGTDYRDIHLDAHRQLAEVLKDFGILRVSPEEAVAKRISNAFFPHGIGHGIGLQVHDVAGFAANEVAGTIAKPDGHPYLRLTRTLEPGMAVTIEPGIYFIDMLLDEVRERGHEKAIDWDRVEAFKPYGGIRIEDDVVCTDGEPLNLSREAFAALG